MFTNFIVLAFRNLIKRKLYSFINILGLALGIAVCLVILKYVDFELSYDSTHQKAARIYRTTTSYHQNGEYRARYVLSGYAQGPALQADIPDVERYVRTHPMYGGAVMSYRDDKGIEATFYEEKIQFVDSTFFDVFDHRVMDGDLSTALDDPASVVITSTIATKYFGAENPIGKVMRLSGGWADNDYTVTAVIDDVPQNATFQFEFLLPIHRLLQNGQYQNDDGWGWNNFVTYVQLHEHSSLDNVAEKLPEFQKKYQRDDQPESEKYTLILQPIREIHLTPGLDNESSETANINTIYFFIVISIFVLAIAWVNYINLSTARAIERSREVGIKKAVGVQRKQLIVQFLSESLLVNFLGIVLALGLASFLLPLLSDMVGKNLAFDLGDYRMWIALLVLLIVGSGISGFYPAFVMSSFKASEVLKGKSEKLVGGLSLRKVLVVFQFASSLILIAGTFAVYRQIVFMRDQDKGLTMEQMLIVNGPSVIDRSVARQRLITLKNEIKTLPGVRSVATSGAIPGGGYNWGTYIRRDGSQEDERRNGNIVWIDPDFVSTYNITVLAGRNFDIANRSDMEGVLVNEAALTAYGLGSAENALNERLILGGDTTNIVGVLKNYHWNSLKLDHSPWLFKADTISRKAYSILLEGGQFNESIKQIEAKYKEAFPGNPFDYYFLDDFFNAQYKDDQQFGKVFGLFAALAIMIACLGLWGLAAYSTNQKLKEIGIRKVMGATVPGIMYLLSWQFIKLVGVASVIGLPVAWFGIRKWLSSFPFRTSLQWDLFVVPVLILLIIALVTVSFQIFRGANTNPAKILRSE